MPTQTVKLVIDWTNVKFSLAIQDPVKTTREERYLPDEIVQLIIDWKELKDAEINREKLLNAYIKAYNKLTREMKRRYPRTRSSSGLSIDERLSRNTTRTRVLTSLDNTVSRLEEEFNNAHDVFRAALLKVDAQ